CAEFDGGNHRYPARYCGVTGDTGIFGLADTGVDRGHHRVGDLLCGGRNFLWLLSGAQSGSTGSDRSAALRIGKNWISAHHRTYRTYMSYAYARSNLVTPF